MEKLFYPDFFYDVFGPIMQPGSSGSFGGTNRVGRIARSALKSEPKRARILFNPSDHHLISLGNMMDDRAYLDLQQRIFACSPPMKRPEAEVFPMNLLTVRKTWATPAALLLN